MYIISNLMEVWKFIFIFWSVLASRKFFENILFTLKTSIWLNWGYNPKMFPNINLTYYQGDNNFLRLRMV